MDYSIKVTKRTEHGINCYGEKYTAKTTRHNYMENEHIICAVVEHEVYGEKIYYFSYPWGEFQAWRHITNQEYKTLAEAQVRAIDYIARRKSNLYIK